LSVVPIDVSIQEFSDVARRIEDEIAKVMVGQAEVVRGIVTAVLGGGHVLLEGVPGLGKTLLIRSLGQVLDIPYSRIQFTPDLMPADITGTTMLLDDSAGGRAFQFQPGPIFASLVLADELNRATPKTQSALLEAMQEHTVTVAKLMHRLPEPFFVMATQNPIEMEGTYPLPEAQLDRFFVKLNVAYPSQSELLEILNRTTTQMMPRAEKVTDGETVLRMTELARSLPIAQPVLRYAARLSTGTHPDQEHAIPEIKRYVRFGSSPRGAISTVIGAKIRALLNGRYNVAFEDVRAAALPSLRHRVLLNYEAEADGVTTDRLVESLIEKLPEDV
jgi:MoxR-like ATPase